MCVCNLITLYFRYYGHGNGTQFLNSYHLHALDLHCIPMLFGCKSSINADKGGRCNMTGVPNGYLKAGW